MRARLRAAWQHVNAAPALRGLLLAEAVALVFFESAGPIEVAYAKTTLHAGDRGYGLLLTHLGSGRGARQPRVRALAQALAGGDAERRRRSRSGSPISAWRSRRRWSLACAAALIGGVGNGVQWASLISAVQRLTPQHLQGRLMGAVESLGAICPALGLALGGALVALSSPRAAFLVVGSARALSTIAFVRLRAGRARPAASTRRRPRPMPSPTSAPESAGCAGLHRDSQPVQSVRAHLKDHAESAVKYDRTDRRDMTDSKLTIRIFWAAEALLLRGALGAAAWSRAPQEWQPLPLVGLLLALALGGQRLEFDDPRPAPDGGVRRAGARDEPARARAGRGVRHRRRRCSSRSETQLPLPTWLNNLATFAVFPLVGGLIVRALVGDVHDPRNQHLTQSVTFGAGRVRRVHGHQRAQLRADRAGRRASIEDRSLIGQVARAVHARAARPDRRRARSRPILAVAYTNLGLPVLFGSVLVLVIFQYLTVALLRSEDRADQLEARSIHLASLQLGVLTTLVETLALRDRMTARHAAAVARYARALASEIGCSRGRAGPRPHRRAAARHRQVRAARPHPPRRGALRRGLGGDPPPPPGRGDARRARSTATGRSRTRSSTTTSTSTAAATRPG